MRWVRAKAPSIHALRAKASTPCERSDLGSSSLVSSHGLVEDAFGHQF